MKLLFNKTTKSLLYMSLDSANFTKSEDTVILNYDCEFDEHDFYMYSFKDGVVFVDENAVPPIAEPPRTPEENSKL